jgi:TonB-linked SusC/RagA family outer membrane protein
MRWATAAVVLFTAVSVLPLTTTSLGAQAPAPQQAQGRITGIVRGAEGAPLAGAQIVVLSTAHRATARADGAFTLPVPPGTYQLRATMLGYAPQLMPRVVVGSEGTVTVNFSLIRQAAALDEMVVIGYGTQRRSDLTGAVSSVNVEQITSVPTSASVGSLLQGRVAGAQVVQNNGAPGGGISVRVRGTNSITANSEPLYVIDGLPAYVGSGGQDPRDNALSAINPQDIESIEVLKDASATAIYGARGSNGVVLITTKLGRRGESKVTVQSTVGTQAPAKYIPMLNGRQFAELANEASVNSGRAVPYSAAALALTGEGTDWQRAVLRTAGIQSHAVTVSGGDDRTRYFVSGAAYKEQGIVTGTDFHRYTARLNLDRAVNARLRIGTGATLSTVSSNEQITDNALNSGTVMSALWYNPNLTVRDTLGAYVQTSTVTFPVYNPVAVANELQNDESNYTVLGNIFAEYKLLEGVQLRSSIGTSSLFQRSRFFAPRIIALGQTANGSANENSGTYLSVINENILTGTRALRGTDQLDLTAGFSVQSSTGEQLFGSNSQFVNDITGVYSLGAGTLPTATSAYNTSALLSYLGRANYNLLGRYIVTVAGRYDGSSRFGASSKWAFFPSTGLAWRVSEEGFMKRQRLFDDVKLRVGYGVTGNEKIGSYNSLARLATRTYAFGSGVVLGYYPAGAAPNPDLKWESTKQTNAGIDLSMFGARVSTSIDVYNSTTSDLLLTVTLPTTSGYTTQLRNVGSVQNRGVELALNTTNLSGPRFNWTSSFTVAGNRNKVLDLGGATELIGPDKGISTQTGQTTIVIRPGEPLGLFLGYRTDGLYQIGDACPLTVKRANLDCVPGEYRYVDVNGDGRITALDRVALGNAQPDYFGGFQNNASFGPVSLAVFVTYSKGGKVLNAPAINLRNINILSNQTADALNRWTPTNTETEIPRANAARPREIYDTVIEDASFVRLQTLTIGLDVPSRLVLGASSARIALTGENLKLWSKYRGYDPEVNSFGGNNVSRGIDLGAYPRPRRFTASLNFTL